VAITRFDELRGTADGQEVEIVGRYERWNPDLAPPGQVPVSARVVLDDGIGVLIGRYREPESRRPDDELDRLAGARVRVAGRFSNGRAFGPGPMPGLWTGGGPQIVEVGQVEMIEAAMIEVARPSTPPPVARHQPEARPAPSPPPAVLPLPAPPPARFAVGTVARRSLAGGRSRMVIAAPLAAFVIAGGCIALVILARHLDVPPRYVVPVVVIGGALAFLATRLTVVRLLAARELRRVAALPWPFDVASYLAQLEGEHTHSTLRIEVELGAPVAEAARASLFDTRRLRRTTIGWPHAHVVSILCPRVTTDTSSDWAYKPRYDNAAIHRWFRRCELAVVQPLAATCGIRAVAAHIE
jgi:hypothetical protein